MRIVDRIRFITETLLVGLVLISAPRGYAQTWREGLRQPPIDCNGAGCERPNPHFNYSGSAVDELLSLPSPAATVEPCPVTSVGENFSDTGRMCKFYENLANATGCNGPGEYPLGYGLKYCEKFAQLSMVDPAIAAWAGRTMACLQQALTRFCPLGRRTCADLKTAAFDSHPRCYTDDIGNMSGMGICDRSLLQGAMVGMNVDLGDLVQPSSVMQIAWTLLRCGGKYATYAHSWFDEFMRNPLAPSANDTPPVKAGKECLASTWFLSTQTYAQQCAACCDKKYGKREKVTATDAPQLGVSGGGDITTCKSVCNTAK